MPAQAMLINPVGNSHKTLPSSTRTHGGRMLRCLAMESFQHDGVWWDPRDPSQRWVGTLRFDRRDGIGLTLTVPVEKPELFPDLREYDVLFGLTSAGKEVTLLRCFDLSSRGHFFGAGAPRTLEIHANALIVGFHTDTADPLLVSVSVSFRHMDDWWGRSGLEWDSSVKQPDLAVRYTSTEPVVLHDDGEFRFSVKSGIEGSVGNRRATLQVETCFQIHASKPTPLSEFQRQVRACGDFLSIACLALCETDELVLSLPTVEGDTRAERGTYHAVPVYRGKEGRSSTVQMLFRFNDVADRAPELFRSWLSHAEELYDPRSLYFAGGYGGGFIEGKLLSLTQAVEAFHRRFRQGLYIEKKQFRTGVLKPLLAAIPEETDERVRKSIGDRLNYANEYSQRERLESLVREFETALRVLVADPFVYPAAIIKHRNAFTHFDPKSRESGGKSSAEPERVLLYNFFLRLLLEACFLESMGFTTSEIATIFQRSETYRQLSVRFRPWAIRAPSTRSSGPSATEES